MVNHRPMWSRCVIGAHLLVVLAAGWVLAWNPSDVMRIALSLVSGTSLFVLTGLVHEASHHLLSSRTWLNDVLGNLAGIVANRCACQQRGRNVRHAPCLLGPRQRAARGFCIAILHHVEDSIEIFEDGQNRIAVGC